MACCAEPRRYVGNYAEFLQPHQLREGANELLKYVTYRVTGGLDVKPIGPRDRRDVVLN